ncbi:transposase [Streptomyces sp. NPDC001286]
MGGRWCDHRQVLDGILYIVCTRQQWRSLPDRYGPWSTCLARIASTPLPATDHA